MSQQEFKVTKEVVEEWNTEISATANRTIANMNELIEGNKQMQEENILTKDLAKQEAYVKSSLDRCRRCGDHTHGLIAPDLPLQNICSKCESALKQREPLIWFADMVDHIRDKEKKQ